MKSIVKGRRKVDVGHGTWKIAFCNEKHDLSPVGGHLGMLKTSAVLVDDNARQYYPLYHLNPR